MLEIEFSHKKSQWGKKIIFVKKSFQTQRDLQCSVNTNEGCCEMLLEHSRKKRFPAVSATCLLKIVFADYGTKILYRPQRSEMERRKFGGKNFHSCLYTNMSDRFGVE